MSTIYKKLKVNINKEEKELDPLYIDISMYEACDITINNGLYYQYNCFIYKKGLISKYKCIFGKKLYSKCEMNPRVILRSLLKFYYDNITEMNEEIDLNYNDIMNTNNTIISEYPIGDE